MTYENQATAMAKSGQERNSDFLKTLLSMWAGSHISFDIVPSHSSGFMYEWSNHICDFIGQWKGTLLQLNNDVWDSSDSDDGAASRSRISFMPAVELFQSFYRVGSSSIRLSASFWLSRWELVDKASYPNLFPLLSVELNYIHPLVRPWPSSSGRACPWFYSFSSTKPGRWLWKAYHDIVYRAREDLLESTRCGCSFLPFLV